MASDPYGLFSGQSPLRPGESILIRSATILTISDTAKDLERGDLLIEGGRISEMGVDLSAPDAFVIDGTGKIAIPGFHDTHRHSWEGQLRRIIPSGDISDYTCTTHGEFAQHYAPEDVYAGTLLTALHAMASGITTILDYSHNSQTSAHCHAAIDALEHSGIRAVYACSAPSILGNAKTDCAWPDVIEDLARDRFHNESGLMSIRVAGTPSTLFADFFALADRLGIGVSIDAIGGDKSSEWILEAEGKGWLGPNRTLIHCTGISDAAWGAIARTGATVSLCPQADMQYVIGEPPLRQALAHGIRPSISVDDDMGLASDMWTQLRILSASYRHSFGIFFKNAHPNSEDARRLTAFDLLDFATRCGALANGLGGRTGRLDVGLEADVVLIDAEDLNNMPLNNAYGSVIHGADTANVSTVIIGGALRKHEGKLVGVDLEALRSLVRRSRDRLVALVDREFGILDRDA